MFHIGPYHVEKRVVLAPMAGVTDQPFRQMCRQLGAGLVVSEMVSSDTRLWNSRKSSKRLDHHGEPGPRAVQIVGNDPDMMADAAHASAARGAEIIDINMGCPARKVCRKAAGSALLRDESLVRRILEAVVAAVPIPVTLKIRTGFNPESRNAVSIARMAEDIGVAALAVHGRTRACKFSGTAEYDTIARVVEAVNIPVLANGDIDSPEKARQVLEHTRADAVMIGRAAQGNPWIFREIQHYLDTSDKLAAPGDSEIRDMLTSHVTSLHHFYGDFMGVRIARKHVGWYLGKQPQTTALRRVFNEITCPREQLGKIHELINHQFRNNEVQAA